MARSGGKNIQAKLVGMFSPLSSFLIFCGNGLVRRNHCRVLCFSLEISNGRKSLAVNYVQGLTTVVGIHYRKRTVGILDGCCSYIMLWVR